MSRRLIVLLAAMSLSSVAVAALLREGDGGFRSGTFDPPRAAPEFSLRGSDGSELTLSRFRGKVVVLEFGFTHCPTVCPVTLGNLRRAVDELGPSAKDVQVVFVTVDPERDTPERLRQYLEFFNPAFLGATGMSADLDSRSAEIDVVQKAYGVFAQRTPLSGGYDVHHSSSVYLIDRNGVLRVLIPFGKAVEDIAHDIQLLLKQ